MDIIIRDMNPTHVAAIDEMAKRKKMSRNAFLKLHIENLAISGDVAEIEDRYEQLVETVAHAIQENNIQLENLSEKIERMNYDKISKNI